MLAQRNTVTRLALASTATLAFALAAGSGLVGAAAPLLSAPGHPSLLYTNYRVPSVPWSIHVVKLDRADLHYQIQSLHAAEHAIGLETLSDQLGAVPSQWGTPAAAINGDFYARDKVYAGAPRGLQVIRGELISGPSGSATFWVDALRQPQVANISSRFQVFWPGGSASSFSLNGERGASAIELYTPAVGASTHTSGGREFVLACAGGGPWLPLRVGQTYAARVLEIRELGDTPLTRDGMVLSIGPAALRTLPAIQTGAVLRLSTATAPALHGVRTAISGGPILLSQGHREKAPVTDSEAYEFSSRDERHPRSALGWNDTSLFLVEVDGRQKTLSVGMTLDELTDFLRKLGCQYAMNLDGGGSATLWYEGSVRNSPCDRAERELANCLLVLEANGLSQRPAVPNPPSRDGKRP